ncbi:MAG: hypothetical protein WA323_12530, partial [Candidatus Nitrosopolaris sp.]
VYPLYPSFLCSQTIVKFAIILSKIFYEDSLKGGFASYSISVSVSVVGISANTRRCSSSPVSK